MTGDLRPATRLFVVIVTTLCAGCFITLGDFDAARITQLEVGSTPRHLVDSLFGAPRDTTDSGFAVLYRYVYSDQDPQPSTPRIDRKIFLAEFVRDTLHGYLYSSSVGDATTDFREDLRDSIAAGRSTAADVRRLLGEPPGVTLLPTTLFDRRDYSVPDDTVPAGSREAWSYAYSFTERVEAGSGYEEASKHLLVFLDSGGRVTGSRYHATGSRFAGGTPWCCPSAVSFRLEKTSCVTMELYDVTGFLLQVMLLDEELTSGRYERTIQFGDLPPGVYYVRIWIDGSPEVKKVMFVK